MHPRTSLAIATLAWLFPLPAVVGQQATDASGARVSPPSPDAPHTAPAALPRGLASFGACRLGTSSFVYGGHHGTAHVHTAANQSGALLELPDGAPRWLERSHGPALQGTALVAHAGRVIRVGGMQARNTDPAAEDLWSSDEVAAFDPVAGTWQPLPKLPEPRSSHDAIVHGDRLFVVGGWTLAGERQTWLTTGWVLDLQAPESGWSALPTPPFQRRALAVTVHGERLFALGGLDQDGEPSPQVDVLDLRAGTWQRGPDLPGFGFAVAAVTTGDALFVSGRDGDLLRHREDGWANAGRLALPRFFHRLLPAADGTLLAIGGASSAHLATNERLPVTDATPSLQSWTLPWTHPARNRQAFVLQGDRLHAIGGNQGKKQHDFAPEHFAGAVATIDLRTLQVVAGPALPSPRQSSVARLHRGSVELLGGFAHRDGAGRAIADALQLDAAGWNPMASLPAPRTQFGAHDVDGATWLLGGIDYVPERGEDGFVFADELLCRVAGGSTFAPTGLCLPRPRRAGGSAVLAGEIWLVGGMREGFTPVPEVDVFAPRTRSWRSGPAPRSPRIAPFLVEVGGVLALVGGSTEDGPCLDLEMLQPGAEAWTSLALPIEAPVLGALAWRERVLVISRRGTDLQLTAVRLPAHARCAPIDASATRENP